MIIPAHGRLSCRHAPSPGHVWETQARPVPCQGCRNGANLRSGPTWVTSKDLDTSLTLLNMFSATVVLYF